MKYTCINIQGNLISEEILQKMEQSEAQGQLATDFGFEPSSNIRSEIEYAWSRIKLDWKHFNDKSQNLAASDPYGTTLSRKWMEQFLISLGFDLSRTKSGLLGDNNHSYTISHTAENLDHLPIHIVGFSEPSHPDKNTLDIKTSGGTSKFSPHGTMQEYLNVTENLYGIATNGLFLRLIRDSSRLIKLTYVEFDIKRMMDEDKYSEFTLLYRLFHASRFPRNKAEADQCLLEKYYQDSIETGNRIRDGLSLAVKESLVALGKGFLQNENNSTLREKIQSGILSPKDYYRQLLRIIYRFLFLMVTEERDLVYDPEDKSETTQTLKKYYLLYYSIARLRKLSESHYVYEAQFNDLWQGLVNTFLLFEGGSNGKKLGIKPLNGDLFSSNAIADLQVSLINNRLLLECVKNLNEFKDENKNLVAINYRSLDVEELGSVYEGLLELHPVIENIETSNPAHINFTFHEGTDRKTTGSYYTRPELVNELIKSALIPVIEERLKEHIGNTAAQVKALLKLKVCDAAAGSGHMLLAAARTIAWYLARLQSGEENPAPSVYRKCLREVIQHCIYAVDYNPDAVELCKLALWLEGHNSGKPLSFLDHKVRNGNSLVGVTDLTVLEKLLPDEAFNPVTGDDKEVCRELKKRNAAYRKTKQIDLFSAQGQQIKKDAATLNTTYAEMGLIEQDTVEAVQEIKKRFAEVRSSVFHEEQACNIWTAAFFKTYIEIEEPTNPSSEKLYQYFFAPTQYGRLVGAATELAIKHRFFHWPLEFPDVFEQGGFDVMLGNPPWVEIQPEEQVFFSTKDKRIASLTGAKRKVEIERLKQNNPCLYDEWNSYKANYEFTSKFIRGSDFFKLTAIGKLNTYSLFSELILNLTSKKGRSSLIIPIGIVTDFSNRFFFSKLILEKRLVSTYGFINSKKIFPDIKDYIKFCIITIGHSETSVLMFFLEFVSDLLQEQRKVLLTNDELKLLNPNTITCPIFRTKIDAELTLKIYRRGKILFNKENDFYSWNVKFKQGLFNMTSDSHLFLDTNSNSELLYPLYEAKMIWHFDQKFSSYENASQQNLNEGNLPQLNESEHQNPNKRVLPKYWVKKTDIDDALGEFDRNWFFIGRGVAPATNERTFIYSIIPFSGVGHSATFIEHNYGTKEACLLLANFNSLIYDFVGSQKLGGPNLSAYILEQLPPIEYSSYSSKMICTILYNCFELQYTSWDIKPFADDFWKEAEADLKAAITRQWEENKEITGGHDWNPPEWCEIDETGCPLPPFKWNDSRRAILKAELDAIYAKLYGLTTEELRYILDPQDVYGVEFPGETFRVLKEKEIKIYGEYRTRRLVLEAWEKLNKSTPSITINLDSTMIDLSLHQGIYSISETATITGFTFQKVTSWFKELSKENYEGINAKQTKDIAAGRISFHGLIELVVIGTLRDNGFSLKKILKARSELSSMTKKIYPFATNNVSKNLKISGSDIVWDFGDNIKVTLDGSNQINIDFIHLFFSDIVFKNDVAQSLMPAKGNNKVIIDPKIGLGKPVIITKEVPVDMIASKYKNDTKAIDILKKEYELDDDEIMAAVAYMQ